MVSKSSKNETIGTIEYDLVFMFVVLFFIISGVFNGSFVNASSKSMCFLIKKIC
jgi:fucose 4-O-acetylase-like acetyltransferase